MLVPDLCPTRRTIRTQGLPNPVSSQLFSTTYLPTYLPTCLPAYLPTCLDGWMDSVPNQRNDPIRCTGSPQNHTNRPVIGGHIKHRRPPMLFVASNAQRQQAPFTSDDPLPFSPQCSAIAQLQSGVLVCWRICLGTHPLLPSLHSSRCPRRSTASNA
ncbi:hypothetical protein C5H21_05205 [Xylella fastidiosa]|nr:hypothetical protein C5H21_05205 [Xylella fastidiosa]